MIKNFRYFVYGYPENSSDPLYAVYQPVLNCFLCVTGNLAQAKTLSALLVSRYVTCICLVSTAENYTQNLIDNEVCDAWTLSNCDDVLIDYSLYDTDLIKAQQLVPATGDHGWDVEKEKQWAMLCLHWLSVFEEIKMCFFNFYQIDSVLSKILPQEQISYFPHHIEQKVMQTLFFENDVEQADLDIKVAIQSEPLLAQICSKYI